MKRLFSIIISLVAVASCIYDYPTPIIEGAEQSLVFDGNIIVGGISDLKITRLSKEPVDYTWWVEDDQGTKYNGNPSTGKADLTAASPDNSYKIVAKCDGKTYSSSLSAPLAPPVIDSLIISSSGLSVNCTVSLQLDTTVSSYVAVSFEEIWAFHADFEKSFDVVPIYNDRGTVVVGYTVAELDFPDLSHYWCWTRHKSTAEALINLAELGGKAIEFPVNRFATSNNRNHREYYIKVYARSLSEKEYNFNHSLSEQDGGLNLFTPNPGEIVGNIVCEDNPAEHVYGYVSTSSSTSAEATIDSRYLVIHDRSTADLFEPSPNVDLLWYMDAGFRPITRIKRGESEIIGWGELRCIDCIAAGGTLEKPEFSK